MSGPQTTLLFSQANVTTSPAAISEVLVTFTHVPFAACSLTVIVAVADFVSPSTSPVTVIVAVPFATPVTTPLEETVATDVLLDSQVKVGVPLLAVAVNVTVSPKVPSKSFG